MKNSSLRRCTWCNCTPNQSLAFYPEHYKPGLMLVIDPRDPTAVICHECSDSVFDAISEFETFEVDEDV
jgi:hypothetical protein